MESLSTSAAFIYVLLMLVIISCMPFELIIVLGDLLELEISYYITVCFLLPLIYMMHKEHQFSTDGFKYVEWNILKHRKHNTHFLNETEWVRSSAGGSFDYLGHQSECKPFSSLSPLFLASGV